jgi:hypothetical protein
MSKGQILLGLFFAALLAAACSLVSGQITFTQDFGSDIESANQTVYKISCDLSDNEDYQDHKDEIKSVEAFGFFVTVKNLGDDAAEGEMWLSFDDLGEAPSIATIKASAKQIVGNANLGVGEERTIDFDESQAYIMNLSEIDKAVKDGVFYLYGITDLGTEVEYKDLNIVITVNVEL